MRILIIAVGRSGGHQLNLWLSLELGYKMIHEPNKTNESTEGDNIVVKYIINEMDDVIINYTKWDKIIGLTRNDIRECAISQTMGVQTNQWRVGYKINDEWIKENETTIQYYEGWVKDKIQSVKEIKEIGIMVTYEGIYYTKEDIQKIKDYIGISNTKYEHLLDNTNRLRNKSKLNRKLL